MANTSDAQQLNIEAGQNIAVKLIAGQHLVLASDLAVQGMKVTSGGELVVTLADGAHLTITNFSEMASCSTCKLTLPNGQSVGLTQLAEALNPQGAIGATNLEYGAPDGKLAAGNGDSHLVKKPGKDEDIVVKLQPGDEYKFSFAMTEPASVKETGGQLVITFKNGGEIIIPNYGAMKDAGALPDFTLADGTKLGVGEFGEVLASATQLNAIEPAAGGDGGGGGGGGGAGGGFGFGSAFTSGPLDGIGKIGPIDPTQLQYRADFREIDPAQDPDYNPSLTTPPAAVVDETNLSPGPVTVDGTVTANFFGDGPGTFGATPTGTNFQYGGSTAPVLTSEGQPVTVTLVGNTYTGTAHGDTIFTLTINADGTYHFELTGTLDHADTTNPDDAIDLQFGVTATDNDGDTDDGFITITVKDDGPVANDDFNSFNGEDLTTTGNVVTGFNGGAGAADDLSEDTGNHVSSVTVNGATTVIPPGGTVIVSGDFGLLTISSTGEYTYTLNPGVHGDTTENFTYTLTDGDGDSDPAILHIDSDGVPTILDPNLDVPSEQRTVDETNLVGGATGVTGQIHANYYTDAPGTLTPTGAGTFSASTGLTSEGNPVTVALVGNTYVGTANGATVFTMLINTDGSYSFTLIGTLDHPNTANPDDIIGLNFGVTATDSDGDSVTASITINVKDDGPVAHDDFNSFNGEDLTTSGNVVTGFHGGPGAADHLSQDDGNSVTSVTVGGVTTTIPAGGSVTVNGTYGVLTISSTGEYTYTLNAGVHGDTAENFTYSLTDGDGDSSPAVLHIDSDGVPTIVDPNNPNLNNNDREVDESDLGPTTASGTITANYYTDTPGHLSFGGTGAFFSADGSTGGALTSEGQPVDVTLVGNTYTGTSHGQTIFTLTLNPDTGAYTFTLVGTLDHADASNPDDVINLHFGVTATDSDGDSATSSLTIYVKDDAPIAHDDFNSFDSEDLTTAGNVVTGVNGGAGAADVLSEDDGNSVTTVTFGTTTVNVPAGGSATIAGANGTLVIHSDGSYEYTLNPGVKGDTADNFTYGLTDGDGDTSNAVLHITSDGTPVIYDPNDPTLSPGERTVDETNLGPTTSVSGDLNANFYSDTPGKFSATGAGTFSFGGSAENGALTSNGYPVTVSLTGNTYTGTANGVPVFTLTITDVNTGAYTFTLLGTLDHADINNPDDVIQLNFGVTATDSDGDSDSATLTINVKDDGPVAHDDHNSYNTADGGTDGNVISGFHGGPGAGDTLSHDDTNTVTKVAFGTTTVDVPAGGSASIHGDHGTLTIHSDGSYTYVLDAGAGGGSGGTSVDTPREFTGNSFPTTLPESTPVTDPNLLGEIHSNMTIGSDTTISGQITFDGAGYTNSLGLFTIAADGTLQSAAMVTNSITGPGASFNVDPSTGATQLGFFLIADGFTNNGGYAGLDFAHGQLNFVYDAGLSTERPATINDAGGHVSLVFTDAGGVDHTINGPIYFTTDRGGSNSLNPDGLVHTISGVGSDSHTLTIGFEDLPGGGDHDYNDVVFNVQITDHTTTGGGDVGDQFTYTLTDGDGDSSPAVLYLDGDGQPVIADPATRTVDESDFVGGQTSVAGHISADFFTDGPGTITPTGVASFTSSTTLTSEGQPVVVTVTGNTYTGTSHGQTIFTLTIDPNGDYKFDLKGTLDHPVTTNPDDAINLTFGVTATDNDGDKDTSTLTIVVKDDGPVAHDDNNAFNAEDHSTTGNVVTGLNGGAGAADKLSQDDVNTVTKVTFGGTTVNVPTTGTATINGLNGVLVIKADGSYTYTLKAGVHGDTADNFTYTLKDGDGDTSTALLKITSDGVPVIQDPNTGPDSRTVDESNLGPETSVTGTVHANFYTDTPGAFQATGASSFTFGGSTAASLTSEGRPVTVTLTGNTYTGTAGGQTIFTLKIDADGNYKFDLKGTLDHADKTDHDDVIQLNFGVTARDSDGDTDTATLTINVRDDGPSAHNDVNNLNITTQTVPVDKDYNVVLVLDVSGSMAGDKLALLKSAVNNLLTTFNNYQGGDVKVHFVTFASQVGAESTFTITNAADFAAAKAFINALVANGNTNYEDALQNAVTWLQSTGTGGPIAGGDTYTYFVSDGEPNTYVNGTNHSASGSAATVMNEIQGIGETTTSDNDGTLNEVGALKALSTQVIAVGIGVSSTTLDRLDVIDSNGNALDVHNPNDLSSALQGSNPVTTVTVEVATGNVITGLNGGAGAADEKSEDDTNVISAVKFGAITVNVPTTGFTTINGDFGTLKIYADGSYTYTVFSGADLSHGVHDTFTYTLKDGDGDTSNATLQFNGSAPAVKTPELTTCDIWVKEDNSVALSVQAKLVTPGAGDQLTITVSGIKDGWTVDTSTSGGTYNATTHTWTLTLAPGVTSYTGGPTVTPPANSDADMAGLVVKATASNGVTTATATGTENVYVDAVADAITVNASNTSGHDNTSIPLTITLGASGDTDGSEKITKVVISGLPAGGSLNHGTHQADGSWVLTKADLTGLTMNPGSYMGNVALTVKAYNVETTLSGLENDTTDNTYIATTNLNVNVLCDPNPPTLEICDVWVKEDKSVALNVQASLNAPHTGEHLVVTISGFKDGWTVDTSASGGTYNATTHTWTITLPNGVNFSGGPTVSPPANSDLDMTGLQVKAVATDGVYSTGVTGSENVFVDAVVDAPILTVPATVNYLWIVNQSNPSALPITTKVTDTDGSETITKVVLDLNNTFTNGTGGYYSLEDVGVKLNKGTETSPGIWTINVNAKDAATALNGLALTTPTNDSYYWPLHNGSHSGTITVQTYAQETTLGGLENYLPDNQTVVTAYICYTFAVSPLVIDLGHNGFDLVGQDQGVLFDMTNDGLKDKTSWVGASDGLLAIDLNHDGVINNQSELFGNNGTASDGFANLAQYDSNGDGKIDASDASFADLKVWQDANQDGVSDAGELKSLTDHGITSISLTTTAVNQMIGENGITDVSSVTYADGSEGQIADVWFNVQDAADRTGVTFRGDASDDYVTGTYKNDFLGGGAGDNVLTGGEGGDTFFLDAHGMAVITDFNLNAGDSLDLSDILTAFDPLTDSLHNFVHAVSDGADTLIQVDPTGTGSAFTTIAVLEGVHVDLNALTAHGNLIA